jgi:hypothetical protein
MKPPSNIIKQVLNNTYCNVNIFYELLWKNKLYIIKQNKYKLYGTTYNIIWHNDGLYNIVCNAIDYKILHPKMYNNTKQ